MDVGGSQNTLENPGRMEDDIQQRRERGKLAQRAFRQRQIVTIRELRDENKKLRDVINAISKAASGNSAALHSAIREARKVIGVDDASSDMASRPWKDAQGAFDESSPTKRAIHHEHCSPLIDQAWDSEFIQPQATPIETLQVCSGLNTLKESAGGSLTINTQHFQPGPSGAFPIEAEMPHVAWFEADRHIKLATPPPDIIPFLGSTAYTVAGQVHWVSLAYNYSAVKALTMPNPPPDAVAVASAVFGRLLTLVPLQELLAVMHGRLLFRKYGVIWGEHPGRNRDGIKALAQTVLDKCELTPKMHHLTAFDVERRLREKLGDGFATFEATLCGRADHQWTYLMKHIMTALARRSLCFGDGPRWTLDAVVEVANRWTGNL